MIEFSRTGKINRWQVGERDLLAGASSGMPGGASLRLTHRGVEHLGDDPVPYLTANQDFFIYTAEVSPENQPQSHWQYKLRQQITPSGSLIICQIEVDRQPNCSNPAQLPVCFGLMMHFATRGNFARLLLNGSELASTNDDYNTELVPLSFCGSQDRIMVEMPHDRFELSATIGAEGIVLDTTAPDRYFGVMLTSGAFNPIELTPGRHIIQTIVVRYEPA